MLTLACTTRDHQMPFSRKFFEFIHMPINYIFDVENGVVSVHRPLPNKPAGDDLIVHKVDIGEMRNWDISMRQVTDRDLPSSFT